MFFKHLTSVYCLGVTYPRWCSTCLCVMILGCACRHGCSYEWHYKCKCVRFTGIQWSWTWFARYHCLLASRTHASISSSCVFHTGPSAETQLCYSLQIPATISVPECHLNVTWHERWFKNLSSYRHTLTLLWDEASGDQYDGQREGPPQSPLLLTFYRIYKVSPAFSQPSRSYTRTLPPLPLPLSPFPRCVGSVGGTR